MSQPLLEVEALRFRHRDAAADAGPALDDVSFAVPAGELLAIVGPSGSGKTTLLRCVAGLEVPTSGAIHLAGQPVSDVPDALAVVFQDYSRSLYPWMTVAANVELPLRHRGLSDAERRERVVSSLSEVGLADAGARHPWQLSGGMQQRVSIARAIAYRPRLLLMDEPFGSVDAQTRADLQDQLLAIWRAHEMTILFVTHDVDEAVYLADRVLVLSSPPTTVSAVLPVAVPRPRDQIETRASPGFVTMRAEVARQLRRPSTELQTGH